MAFGPADFLSLAFTLRNGDEASRRSAVSRAYYASFLHARERLTSTGRIVATRTGRDHQRVIGAIRLVDSASGNMLDRLRRLRTRADYDLTSTVSSGQANNAVSLAFRLWPRL